MQKTTLRQLLLGSPLNDRESEAALAETLDKHLKGLEHLIPRVYGTDNSVEHAVREVQVVREMDSRKADQLACKRAMLLCAVAAERGVCDSFAARDDGFSLDLRTRVLPFVLPRYLKTCCQNPEAFAVLVMVLSEMWYGERLGNWPHQDSSV